MEPLTIAVFIGTVIGSGMAAAIHRTEPDEHIDRYKRRTQERRAIDKPVENGQYAAVIGATQTASYLVKRLETVERFQRDAELRIISLEERLKQKDEEIADLNRKVEALRTFMHREYGKEITDEELEKLVKENHDETNSDP